MVVLPYTTEELLRRSRQPSETMRAQLEAVEERGASLQQTETTRASDLVSAMPRTLRGLDEAVRNICEPFETSTAMLRAVAAAIAAYQTSSAALASTALRMLKPSGALFESLQLSETERQRQSQSISLLITGACSSCNSKKHTGPPPIPVQPMLLTVAPRKKTGQRGSHDLRGCSYPAPAPTPLNLIGGCPVDHALVTAAVFVLVAGLYGYAIYGTIVITRLLRESQDMTRESQALTREVLRRLPDQR